jgi:hypothetical protein
MRKLTKRIVREYASSEAQAEPTTPYLGIRRKFAIIFTDPVIIELHINVRTCS